MSEDRGPGYLLRNRDDNELTRLEFQHRVWSEETSRLLQGAGFGAGQTLADLGCGPGYLSLDLAEIVGPGGHIHAIDSSEKFIAYLEKRLRAEGRHHVTAHRADVSHVHLADSSLDGAVARWVMMFVSDPEAVIGEAARLIKPGGILAVMEYFHFRSLSLWPESQAFADVYDAVFELIRQHGGDPDIGARMPEIVSRHGFRVQALIPVLRVGRPGSDWWQWLEMTSINHENVVDAELVSAATLEDYHRDWTARSANPHAFFSGPPVLGTVAVRV